VFCGIVQGEANEPGMQIRLSGKEADPVLLATLQLLQARDNFPHIRACGQRCAAVMGGPPENDSRVVKLAGSLNDELIQQRCSGHALAGGA